MDKDVEKTGPEGDSPKEQPIIEQRKKQRIEDLIGDSLDLSDPLHANRGVVTAELMEMASQIKATATVVLERSRHRGGNLAEALPAIETYLKCLRQADRFAHLDVELRRPVK